MSMWEQERLRIQLSRSHFQLMPNQRSFENQIKKNHEMQSSLTKNIFRGNK